MDFELPWTFEVLKTCIRVSAQMGGPICHKIMVKFWKL